MNTGERWAKEVIRIFDNLYPNTSITNVKKIDIALWSMGKKANHNCPQCGSAKILPIIYGMPSPELFEQNGIAVYLDGCCVEPYDLYCKDCEHKFIHQVKHSER